MSQFSKKCCPSTNNNTTNYSNYSDDINSQRNCNKPVVECVRGPQGIQGPTGISGSPSNTGPTGPCCTGPTGPSTVNNLQQVLDAGNVATGASAYIILNNTGVGSYGNPQLNLTNSNATVGNTTGVPLLLFNKTGRNVVQNDIIATQSFFAKNYIGTLQEWGRIESVITNSSAAASDDAALDFYTCVNSANSLVMRLNGDDNENNFFRPLDMNGNAIKTSTGNMTITSSTSGNLTMSSGTGGGSVNINGLGAYITTNGTAGDTLSLSSASTINLTATTNIEINPAGQLIFSPNLEQSSSTGSSGKFLKIKLNGVDYCIPLDFA